MLPIPVCPCGIDACGALPICSERRKAVTDRYGCNELERTPAPRGRRVPPRTSMVRVEAGRAVQNALLEVLTATAELLRLEKVQQKAQKKSNKTELRTRNGCE